MESNAFCKQILFTYTHEDRWCCTHRCMYFNQLPTAKDVMNFVYECASAITAMYVCVCVYVFSVARLSVRDQRKFRNHNICFTGAVDCGGQTPISTHTHKHKRLGGIPCGAGCCRPPLVFSSYVLRWYCVNTMCVNIERQRRRRPRELLGKVKGVWNASVVFSPFGRRLFVNI